jgi:hypothetical protein
VIYIRAAGKLKKKKIKEAIQAGREQLKIINE